MSGTLQSILTRAGTSGCEEMQLASSCCAVQEEYKQEQEGKTHATCPAKLWLSSKARAFAIYATLMSQRLISQEQAANSQQLSPAVFTGSSYLRLPQDAQTLFKPTSEGGGMHSTRKCRVKRADMSCRPPPGGAQAASMVTSTISFQNSLPRS